MNGLDFIAKLDNGPHFQFNAGLYAGSVKKKRCTQGSFATGNRAAVSGFFKLRKENFCMKSFHSTNLGFY
ncbi:hypothetical protein PJP10_32945, partial [Mycobacterium kansasii]